MKFAYSSIISAEPGSSDFFLIRRPEIPVTIIGPGGSMTLLGLVDTGSDNTIFPKSVADHLQIPTQSAAGPSASVFGGQQVELLLGNASLLLEVEGEPSVTWPAWISFYNFPSPADESIILGHAGFLDYFMATFDGERAELTLIPNASLPST